MILQALYDYYHRLEEDPEVDIAPFGYSRQNISLCVVLNADGSLDRIQDVRRQEGKKTVPLRLVVAGNSKPTGSGINPCFLWDNPAYMLGYKPDDPKPERTAEAFEAFRQRHLNAEDAISDEGFSAVCRFLEQWHPSEASKHAALADVGTGFGVFKLRRAQQYLHERPAVEQWWQTQLTAADEPAGARWQCLITGEVGPIARLHEPKIKGVWGGQMAGALIVSFNDTAYTSYGKEDGANAPVLDRTAFAYCTALNHLLRPGSPQRIQIGDATTVFWTDRPTEAENLLPWVFEPTRNADDEELRSRLQGLLKQISAGEYPAELGPADARFYVLGLSPNAARVSVRFWYQSTLGDIVDHVRQHFDDLAMATGPRDPEYPALWQLLRETVRESKDLPPLLGGTVARAILTGARYPAMFFGAVIRRVRADREVRYLRAAILKACIVRNARLVGRPKEVPMSLNQAHPDPAYHMGRLFAALEYAQTNALGNVNRTIKDGYFGTASASPSCVFPRLIKLHQHHVEKAPTDPNEARRERKRTKRFFEVLVQEVCSHIDVFPTHLPLEQQGLFQIGYYHQRQDFFTKKSETAPAEEISA